MRTINLIVLDVRNGIVASWQRGVVAVALFLLMDVMLYRLPEILGEQAVSFSLGDYFVNTFAGVKEFFPELNQPIILPFAWLAIILLILYFTLNYPYKDLEGIGKHILILSGGRRRWWVAKCFWVCLNVLLYFLIWLAVAVFWVLMTKGNFDFAVSPELPAILGFEQRIVIQPPWNVSEVITTTVLVVIALCLLQMLVSLCTRPVLAFMVSITILLFSTYFTSPFLMGNYLMAARSQTFVFFGVNWASGALASIGIMLIVVVLGGWLFGRMDIRGRED